MQVGLPCRLQPALTPGGVNYTTHAMLRGVAKVQDNRCLCMFGTTCDMVVGIESLELSRHVSWSLRERASLVMCIRDMEGQGA